MSILSTSRSISLNVISGARSPSRSQRAAKRDARLSEKLKKLYKRFDVASKKYPHFLMAFSGGKDSTALVALLTTWLASHRSETHLQSCTLLFCDTGVENPHVRAQAMRVLDEWENLGRRMDLKMKSVVVSPPPRESFLVKVIGRGYPAPSNRFRWCTDRLRVKPVQNFLRNHKAALVLLGVRRGESRRRDDVLKKQRIGKTFFFRQDGRSQILFCPLLNFTTAEVWRIILGTEMGTKFSGGRLSLLYRDAAGGCPSVVDPRGSPCGAGRFGCWTCTVVDRDKSGEGLAAQGWQGMNALLRWRSLLRKINAAPQMRWRRRRNGQPGPGPLTLAARRKLLEGLRLAEKQIGNRLISDAEEVLISHFWALDSR